MDQHNMVCCGRVDHPQQMNLMASPLPELGRELNQTAAF
jgi:hypothetical protein